MSEQAHIYDITCQNTHIYMISHV